MTTQQMDMVKQMRMRGMNYSAIAERLDESVNSVKSYGRRCGVEVMEVGEDGQRRCMECGTVYKQPEGRKEKRFCCEKCRLTWWHRNKALSSVAVKKTCPGCGRVFYARPEQRHCSHPCYIRVRFSNGGNHHVQSV